MKTREEVNRLKNLWLEDPAAFDLANVEGYEEYRDELNLFALEHSVNEPPIGQASNLIGPIPPDILNAISSLFGVGGQRHRNNPTELLDKLALLFLDKLLGEIIGYKNDEYYQMMGASAYRKAYLILEIREQVIQENCPCPSCVKARKEQK